MTQTFDARELAKFFKWIETHAEWDSASERSRDLCDLFKEGHTIAVRDEHISHPNIGYEETLHHIEILWLP